MPSFLLATLVHTFFAFALAAAQATGQIDSFSLLWDGSLHEGCNKIPISAIVSTYADGEELIKYGLYNKSVKFDFYSGPKLQYLSNRTSLIDSDWCSEEYTAPRYINSNEAQKFEVGQNLNDTYLGTPKAIIYLKVFEKAKNKSSNCILKLSLTGPGVPSSLQKESGCTEEYSKLQILNYHRSEPINNTNDTLDRNLFWIYWDDAPTSRPATIETGQPSAAPGPTAAAPMKPVPINQPPPDSASITPTSSAVRVSSHFNVGLTAWLAAFLVSLLPLPN